MSRSKLFNMLKSRGSGENGRNYFDLSNSHAYGMKAGYITPLKCLHTLPDDYFDVNISDFTQTDAMATAAFLRGRKEIAGYFVPYNTIWHNFNQYQATREDPQSALLKDKGILFEPRINMYNLLVPAMEFFYHYLYCEYYLKAANVGTHFDHGFNPDTSDYRHWRGAVNAYLNSPIGTLEFYVNNTHTGLRDNYSLVGISQIDNFTFSDFQTNTFTIRDVVTDTVGEYRWCNYLRKLDMLGYGNWYPLFFLAEKGFNAYLESLEYPLSREQITTTVPHELNDVMYTLALRIARRVYNSSVNSLEGLSNLTQKYISIYPLYAYNHIFYTMFRNSYYDLNYDVRNFNVDFLDCSTLNGSIVTFDTIPVRWYNLECHQWKKDKFTAIMPDTQFGAVSSVVLNSLPQIIGGVTSYDTGRYQSSKNGSSFIDDRNTALESVEYDTLNAFHGSDLDDSVLLRHDHTFNAFIPANTNSLNVLALKRAEALQQYRQDLLRAGNHTHDIFKQIYGSSPKSQLDEHSYFVDVCGGDVIIDPVVSTASTGDSVNGSLGDIAARAIINTGGKFKLSVSDFGCFIFLAYVVPESMYNSFMIDQHLMNLTQEDHFIPQLMNLGFEPLINESLNCLSSDGNHTRGFALPYIEFKTDVDQCHGNFCDFYDESMGSADYDWSAFFPTVYEGSKSHWVAPRTDMQLQSVVTLRNFYIDPRVLNNVFLVAADGTYETDQFTCFTRIEVNSTRQLSELGLPRFC